eukprot:TRINITY_DN9389_c0_g3_i1.p1 TRINITY_DN9389_c0_g3~~TRINITY_DN9389_c0_g3_i1.p1  ORF type:complete len:119 (+),score=20.12 TRINITY_DN9389_c0_g3_i1:34-357(+)
MVTQTWLKEVAASYTNDAETQQLVLDIQDGRSPPPTYSLDNGIVKYKNKIYVGKGGQIRVKLVKNIHGDPVGGYSGVLATYKRANSLFYWKGLFKDIKRIVAECDIC